MTNELWLLISVLLYFGGTLLFYYLMGAAGLYCWNAVATVAANIEVLVLIDAYGMEQTLGNVMFASTFLVTDIISEIYGKEKSNRAVDIGIVSSLMFILISQLWLQYTPSANDWAMPHMQAIFSNTPRLMIVSFLVYAVSQRFDVWAYHKWWAFTDRKFHDHKKFLWLRNNGSTMISQLLNTLLFTFGAFIGVYDMKILWSIFWSSYIIYLVTSLLDTPFVYLARKITPRCEG
ncbi:MAG TPA: transporter [Lachnospiraceae bacterium]|nr:transporter [Lachnospiraceae bacterium]